MRVLHAKAAALQSRDGLRRRCIESLFSTVKPDSSEVEVFSPLSKRQAITTLGKAQLLMKIAALVDGIHRLLLAPLARYGELRVVR